MERRNQSGERERMADRPGEVSSGEDKPHEVAQRLAREAVEHARAGRRDEALRLLDHALDTDPNYAWAYAHRGELYRMLGYEQRALDDLSRAIELRPSYAWALAHRGALLRQIGRNDKALIDFDRAIDLVPDYAWALTHRAEIYVTTGRYEMALEEARRVVKADPSIASCWRGEQGLLLNYLGRYSETIKLCEKTVRRRRSDHVAWYSLAVAETLKARSNRAKPALHRTLESARSASQKALDAATEAKARAGALYRLAGLAVLREDSKRAIELLEQAVRHHPEPREIARHDPVWHALRRTPRMKSLLG